MEKTLNIDGKNIRFKATAGTLVRYKSETGREFLTDLLTLHDFYSGKSANAEIIETSYGVAWAMAKTADKDIPDLLTWLDEFEEFNIFEIFNELFPMLDKFLKVDAKNA